MTYSEFRKFPQQLVQVAATALVFAFAHSTTTITEADASELAKSTYPPGFRAAMSGLVPPADSTTVSSFSYFYSGEASGAVAASVGSGHLGGNFSLQADIKAEAQTFIEIPNALWMTPYEILGGNLGFGFFVPVGWQEVSVDVTATGILALPRLGIVLPVGGQLSVSKDTVEFGDPLAMAVLGWTSGNWHWNVAGTLNIPIGAYDKTSLTNIGFNRWSFDTTGSATWLDPHKGHEVSVAAGFTFNGENPDTNYKTGTEFHLEFALMQHFSKALAIGLAGYHFQQVTGDSGAGAVLGGLKGRVTALGPNISYNFLVGRTPVLTSLRWLHEFNVKNRMKGDAAFFTVSVPLGGGGHH